MADVQVDTFGLRINQDVCFTTHNNKLHMGTTKRQLKILRGVAPLLSQVLKPDEEILLAVRAASPYGPSGVGSRRCGYGGSPFGSVRRRVDRHADR